MRYAIYYSPPEKSLLHQLGASWLGYNAFTGKGITRHGNGLLDGKTEAASRYGFHATLKAPFFLNDGMPESALISAVAELSASVTPVRIGKLVLREIDGFLALVPEVQSRKVSELAGACVQTLDVFRKQPDEVEIIRRRAENLSPRQHRYLTEWGYPYVFEEFGFHMTLSRRLDPAEQPAVLTLAQDYFAEVIDRPLVIDTLTVFTEATSQGLFKIEKQFQLAAKKLAVPA